MGYAGFLRIVGQNAGNLPFLLFAVFGFLVVRAFFAIKNQLFEALNPPKTDDIASAKGTQQ